MDRPNIQTCLELYHVSAAYFIRICYKHNSLLLGLIQPSSPSAKELHDMQKITLQVGKHPRGKVRENSKNRSTKLSETFDHRAVGRTYGQTVGRSGRYYEVQIGR